MDKKEDNKNYSEYEIQLLKSGAFDKIVAQFFDLVRNPTILDLGAGPGTWEVALQPLKPKKIYWHDLSDEFMKTARKNCTRYNNVEFNLKPMEDLSDYADNQFDLVVCRLALYHGKNERAILESLLEKTKPGGYLYIESPNFRRVIKTIRPWDWRFVPALTLPIVYSLTGRKFGPTLFHLENHLRKELTSTGFEIVYWKHPSPQTFQSFARKPI